MKTKNEYQIMRNDYKSLKDDLLKKISFAKEDEIQLLKKQIEDSRPQTEHGDRICPDCDCTSMEFFSRNRIWDPQGDRAVDMYSCEICGYRDERDIGLWDNMKFSSRN